MLYLRLPPEIERRLGALAKAAGKTKTYFVREAICEHLDDLEDIFYAEQALADIHAGRVKTIPLEDVMREYGMTDLIRSQD